MATATTDSKDPRRPRLVQKDLLGDASTGKHLDESVDSGKTMVNKRNKFVPSVLMLMALITSGALGSATALAADLGDYLWERRPLLLFAPTNSDPRLLETLGRIEASRCEFDDRDMVVGLVVAEGNSTLDGQVINAYDSQRLTEKYAIDADSFSVLLIGKDGGEKLRVNEVPDLQAIYDVIDGMPMRSREMSATPSQC